MQNPDAKKEEFRKYLEKAGVIDSLTKGACWPHRPCWPSKRVLETRIPTVPPRIHALPLTSRFLRAVLVGLYEEPERPAAAVDYVKRYMGAPVGVDADALRAENERLRSEVASLQQQLEAAQRTINQLSAAGGSGAAGRT